VSCTCTPIVYIRLCTHTHIHTYIHTHAYMHTPRHMHTCIRPHTCMPACIHTYTHPIQTCMHACITTNQHINSSIDRSSYSLQ
jgi:hypothetical protein